MALGKDGGGRNLDVTSYKDNNFEDVEDDPKPVPICDEGTRDINIYHVFDVVQPQLGSGEWYAPHSRP